jgi:hypothetical protein
MLRTGQPLVRNAKGPQQPTALPYDSDRRSRAKQSRKRDGWGGGEKKKSNSPLPFQWKTERFAYGIITFGATETVVWTSTSRSHRGRSRSHAEILIRNGFAYGLPAIKIEPRFRPGQSRKLHDFGSNGFYVNSVSSIGIDNVRPVVASGPDGTVNLTLYRFKNQFIIIFFFYSFTFITF